jgi:hypothetical protein
VLLASVLGQAIFVDGNTTAANMHASLQEAAAFADLVSWLASFVEDPDYAITLAARNPAVILALRTFAVTR